MYNKKNERNKRKIIYITLTIILFIIFIFIFINKQNFINNSFFNSAKSYTSKITYYLKSPFITTYDYIKDISNIKNIRKENINLKLENQELKTLIKLKEEQTKELNILKEELKLKNLYTDYELETAKVIIRNTSYWFNNITIDKGSSSNISIGDAVVTQNGLIGIIKMVSKTTSVVNLITSKDNNIDISVAVKGSDEYHHGTITDYKDNLLVISGITNYDKVNINSKVLTSGLGMFPSGILVGYVEKLDSDNYDISKILYVKPNEDINNLKYVTVLRNKK